MKNMVDIATKEVQIQMMCNSDSESIGPGVAHICLHLHGETATDRIGHEYMQRHRKQGDRNCCVLRRNSNKPV